MTLIEDMDKRFSWLMHQYETAKVVADGLSEEFNKLAKVDVSSMTEEEHLKHDTKRLETERNFYLFTNYVNIIVVALSDYNRIIQAEKSLEELKWLSAKLEERQKKKENQPSI